MHPWALLYPLVFLEKWCIPTSALADQSIILDQSWRMRKAFCCATHPAYALKATQANREDRWEDCYEATDQPLRLLFDRR